MPSFLCILSVLVETDSDSVFDSIRSKEKKKGRGEEPSIVCMGVNESSSVFLTST